MNKNIKIVASVLCIVICAIFGGSIATSKCNRVFPEVTETDSIFGVGTLDHDINVGEVSQICNEKKTGFDVEVGPTGWPVGVSQEWEVALYEDSAYYYGRLIYHEFMLWFTFDDPYIVCKIPKCNVNGNLRTDIKLRYQVLWDITYTTLRTYNYKPYMPNAVVQKINGHTVEFGDFACKYEKYFVICDADHRW